MATIRACSLTACTCICNAASSQEAALFILTREGFLSDYRQAGVVFREVRFPAARQSEIDHTTVWSIFALDFGLGRGYDRDMRNNDAV